MPGHVCSGFPRSVRWRQQMKPSRSPRLVYVVMVYLACPKAVSKMFPQWLHPSSLQARAYQGALAAKPLLSHA